MLIVCQENSKMKKRVNFENFAYYVVCKKIDADYLVWGNQKVADSLRSLTKEEIEELALEQHVIVACLNNTSKIYIGLFIGTEQECNHIDQIIRNAVRMKKEILDLTIYTKEYFDNYNKDLDQRIS